MLFNSFPRECGPPRKTVYNQQEWNNFVNKYNGFKNAIYTSIYSFEHINDDNKPDYVTAIINCLFFDFDDKSCNAYAECKKLHEELLRENIKHFIVMSGRGYHLFILTIPLVTKNSKDCIYNAQHFFIDKLGLHVDTQVVGNPAQLARVQNTYNIRAKRFCIPLTLEQFNQGDEYVKNLAIKQNFIKDFIIGEKELDIRQFDFKSQRFNETLLFDEEFEDSSKVDYMRNAPNCIKNILNKKDTKWKERYLVILYFKESGYTEREIYNILKHHLSESKFRHCISEERQLQYLFEREDLIFPKCQNIIKDGFCMGLCEKYNKTIYK